MGDFDNVSQFLKIFITIMRTHDEYTSLWEMKNFQYNVATHLCTSDRLVMMWDHHENSDYWERLMMSHPRFIGRSQDLISSYYTYDIKGVNVNG